MAGADRDRRVPVVIVGPGRPAWSRRSRGPGRAGRHRRRRRLGGRDDGLARRHPDAAGPPRPRAGRRGQPDHARRRAPGHLEPVLLRHLRTFGLAEVRFGTELVDLDQDADGVTVELRERATGELRTVRAGYVVGADGAHSRTRELLGIAMDGPDHLNEQLTVLFEARCMRSWATAATAASSSSTRRPGACSCPTAETTGGCTGAAGTRSTNGWTTTPTPVHSPEPSRRVSSGAGTGRWRRGRRP
jgi:hypothetical protein